MPEKPGEKPQNLLWEFKKKKRRKEKEKSSSTGQHCHGWRNSAGSFSLDVGRRVYQVKKDIKNVVY